ncbi:ubiquinone/menaquinone biosynthesis methyltransferase, partial [Chloroflexota bacterium]
MVRPLYDIFNAVPRRYDLVNRIITWGLDKRWRLKAAESCLLSRQEIILDLCCGTGDLAIQISRLSKGEPEIIGLDYSQPMLDIANEKAKLLNRKPSFVSGDAASLPFPDDYFDCVGISFAFRNLTYKNPLASQYVSEVKRVLKPNGRFVIIESSQPNGKVLRTLFHLYLYWFVFKVGALVSGNKGAYRYLAESATRFYTPLEIRQMLITAGFSDVSFRPFLF